MEEKMFIESFLFLSGEKTRHGYKATIEITTSDKLAFPVELDFDEDGRSNLELLYKYEHKDRDFLEDHIYHAILKKHLLELK